MNEIELQQVKVIAAMLLNPDCIPSISEIITAEDFTQEPPREMFKAMLKLINERKQITPESIVNTIGGIIGSDPATLHYMQYAITEYQFTIGRSKENAHTVAKQLMQISTAERAKAAVLSCESIEEMASLINPLYYSTVNKSETRKQPHIAEYLKSQFDSDMKDYQSTGAQSTGFKILDNHLGGGLHAGLHVLGAVSSLGKTTFALQIADNIAQSGTPVLFFSLEQSALELVTKSIARINAQQQKRSGTPRADMGLYCTDSLHLRKHGIQTEESKAALNEYTEKIAPNLYIYEGNFNTSIESIQLEIFNFIQQSKRKPVIFIDYLQIIPSGNQQSSGIMKDTIDRNVTALKMLSRDINTPIIVISSFNRANYMQQVSFESFKESGNIEYTADTVLALQLAIVSADTNTKAGQTFNSDKGQNTKRLLLRYAKSKIPRVVQLVCLKNRNGAATSESMFFYNPKYDLFEEVEGKAANMINATQSASNAAIENMYTEYFKVLGISERK